jgi:hypothetical protein
VATSARAWMLLKSAGSIRPAAVLNKLRALMTVSRCRSGKACTAL